MSGLEKSKELATKFFSGIGSFFSSVKEKTLNFVDDLQDQIEEAEQKTEDIIPEKVFDTSLLPIIENAATYIDEPTNPLYQDFLNSFNSETKVTDTQLFFDNCPNLRRMYSRLVPGSITENIFWARLFFKLKMREEAQKASSAIKDSLVRIENDNEIDLDSNIELTKEEIEELEKMAMGSDEDWAEWN